jgi:hypothetical protein
MKLTKSHVHLYTEQTHYKNNATLCWRCKPDFWFKLQLGQTHSCPYSAAWCVRAHPLNTPLCEAQHQQLTGDSPCACEVQYDITLVVSLQSRTGGLQNKQRANTACEVQYDTISYHFIHTTSARRNTRTENPLSVEYNTTLTHRIVSPGRSASAPHLRVKYDDGPMEHDGEKK